MYRKHESLITQVTNTADDIPVIVTRLASVDKSDIEYYFFSHILRVRVLQIVCGILAVVMGSVACIEDKGSFANLGLGIPAGLSTVLAAATSIYTSRIFNGYNDTLTASSNRTLAVFRLLGPTFQSAIAVGLFWSLALVLNVMLFTRAGRALTEYQTNISSNPTMFWLAVLHLTLSSLVLIAVGAIVWLDCHHDPD
ncbi:uncharacterized protein LOC126846726 [Adelges cooleyi]|uniref:uncharacterized protein LOC126846726 n=1 Tax=Adelges cooleyi TaxID=133065 RepID=UPI00218024B0|nr:uncharacterized protein LOC126846726 [Adelges cooleyi]